MGAPDLAAAHMDRGNHDLLRRQAVQQQAHCGDVRHRVQSPHLMEVDLRHRHAVGVALRLGDQAVDRQDVRPDRLRQVQMVPDQMFDLMERAVVVLAAMGMAVVMLVMVLVIMVMGMFMIVLMAMLMSVVMAVVVVALLLHAVHGDGDMSPGDAALHGGGAGHPNARQPQAVELPEKGRRVRQQLQQRGGEHIAGGAHAAVQIQSLQGAFLLFTSIWLIMLARYPAPKPLSMFTTDTPLAQELSIDSRADRPWKEAP